MTILPEKPSALIRLALGDLRKVEQDERYEVYMGDWHNPGMDGTCEVCLAGAVMAMSLGADIRAYSLPSDFHEQDQATTERLLALNQFRTGHINAGLTIMRYFGRGRTIPVFVTIPSYHTDPEAFYATMDEVAGMLEGAGI